MTSRSSHRRTRRQAARVPHIPRIVPHGSVVIRRALLLDVEWLGAVRVSRMVEDHVEEHRAMRQGLAATPTGELRGVLASLRDHLATEERDFLSRKVLRDDLAGLRDWRSPRPRRAGLPPAPDEWRVPSTPHRLRRSGGAAQRLREMAVRST